MEIEIKKSFSKDIDKIRDKKILNTISDIIIQIEKASILKEIKLIKKLDGSKKHNQIKIGDYRFGLFVEENIIYLVRFLHRKEIYRYVP
jgi:mRNA interferase RelE/StbE